MNPDITDLLLTALLSLLVIALRWVAKKAELSEARTEALEAILSAVAVVKSTYVDELKKASDDGTLTDDEKKAALKKATDLALQTAGPKAAALLTEWGADKVRGLIEQAVLKTKQ